MFDKADEAALSRFKLLAHDDHVGKQLITFSEYGWEDRLGGLKVRASYWWVASNSEGEYGMVGGGMKNLESFIGWMFGVCSYSYNPINLSDYQWSRTNNAFLPKGHPMCTIPVQHGDNCFYIFCRDNRQAGPYTRIYIADNPFSRRLIWEESVR